VVPTGFAMAYPAGYVIGSMPIGFLMDLFGAEALLVTVAVGFAALLIFLVRPGQKKAAEAVG